MVDRLLQLDEKFGRVFEETSRLVIVPVSYLAKLSGDELLTFKAGGNGTGHLAGGCLGPKRGEFGRTLMVDA